MNTELKVFENNEFGKLRVTMRNGEPWFVGKDVATALGYAKPRNAIGVHVDEVDKTTAPIQGSGSNYKSKAVIINESGMYSLILSSKLEGAKRFKRWVTAEVLPSIRKNGVYMTDDLLDKVQKEPKLILKMAETLIAQRDHVGKLESQLAVAQPKADYYDAFVNSDDSYSIRVVAKELKIPERKFVKFLLDEKFLYRSPSGSLLPYNRSDNSGLFRVSDSYAKNWHGTWTTMTSKGKDEVRKLIAKRQEESENV